VARLVHSRPREVVFTAGGTEANNLALRGTGRTNVLVSAIEHPSVLQAVTDPVMIPVDRTGRIDLAALERLLADSNEPGLISVMAANNETGVIQPIPQVVDIAHRHGALVHSDAVQAVGRLAEGWQEADLVTISAHKLGGMQGAGALIVRNGLAVSAVARGGGQEMGLRAGTEAVPAIAAFGAAATEATKDDWSAIRGLRDDLEARLTSEVPDAVLLGAEADRLPNTIAIAHDTIDAETMVMSFDLEGVAISAGAACSSGKMAASHVAEAMGRADLARRVVRLSLGWSITAADCDRAVAAWSTIHRRFGSAERAA